MLTVTLTPDVANVTLDETTVVVTLGNVGPQGASGARMTWNEVTTTSVQLTAGQGFVMNNASRVIGLLPSPCAFGQEIKVAGKGAGGWKIAQNDGQTIHFDENSTTTGPSGYLASQRPFDGLTLLCITENTDFLVTNSIGNITGS